MLHYVSSVFVTMAMCPVCGVIDFKFVSKRQLQDYVESHSSEKLLCDACGRDCKTTRGLYMHNNKFHGNEKYICPECNTNFNLKCNLDKLISYIHTDATSN